MQLTSYVKAAVRALPLVAATGFSPMARAKGDGVLPSVDEVALSSHQVSPARQTEDQLRRYASLTESLYPSHNWFRHADAGSGLRSEVIQGAQIRPPEGNSVTPRAPLRLDPLTLISLFFGLLGLAAIVGSSTESDAAHYEDVQGHNFVLGFGKEGSVQMNPQQLQAWVEEFWTKEILPDLIQLMKVPSVSPKYDKQWQENGFIDKSVQMMHAWFEKHKPAGSEAKILRLDSGEHPPVLLIDIPATGEGEDVLFYGHLDVMPGKDGWTEIANAWDSQIKGDKLFGRGGVDDGYAGFMALAAVKVLEELGLPHPRVRILLDAEEESGSPGLAQYLEEYVDLIGKSAYVFCLDSRCGDYERFWTITSMRGILKATLKVVTQDPSDDSDGQKIQALAVMERLLRRLEMDDYGVIQNTELVAQVPEERRRQAQVTGEILGDSIVNEYPWAPGVQIPDLSYDQVLLGGTWASVANVIDGSSEFGAAYVAPYASKWFSFKMPQSTSRVLVQDVLEKALTRDLPQGVNVAVDFEDTGDQLSVQIRAEVLQASSHSGGAGGKVPQPQAVIANLVKRLAIGNTGAVRRADLTGQGLQRVAEGDVEVELFVRPSPTFSVEQARELLPRIFTQDLPPGVNVDVHVDRFSPGWEAGMMPWQLSSAIEEASQAYFNNPPASMGTGGYVGLVGLLASLFPQAIQVVIGLMGPGNNAHVQDESLDIPAAQKMTMVLAHVLASMGVGWGEEDPGG